MAQIETELIKAAQKDYTNSTMTLRETATKHGIGGRTIDKYAAEGNWVQQRKDARYRALQAAKEQLAAVMTNDIKNWDRGVLDSVAQMKLLLNKTIEPTMDRDGNEVPMTVTQIQRAAEALAKLNTIQRTVTERDITKVQQIDSTKLDELTNLFNGIEEIPQDN